MRVSRHTAMPNRHNKSVAHGAAGRAGSEINVVCRGPVNGDVSQLAARASACIVSDHSLTAHDYGFASAWGSSFSRTEDGPSRFAHGLLLSS